MNHTPQQTSFIEEMARSTSSIALEACAGSGKTTTLVAGINADGAGGLACAFNKKNAEDLRGRIKPTWTAKTMNALGHAAWSKQVSSIRLDAKKLFPIMRQVVSFQDSKISPDIKRLVDVARLSGIIPKGAPGWAQRDDDDDWLSLIETYDLDVQKSHIGLARKVLAESNRIGFSGLIDFNDQLYLPVVYGAPFEKFPRVVVDEFQDLALLQHDMIAALLAPGGHVIGAGDSHQAIYQFRGADHNSISTMVERFSMKTMPLTKSFRCPKAVVHEARNFASHIEAVDAAPEGEIFGTRAEPLPIPDSFPQGSAVICRNNAPLVALAFSLLARGIPCKILGRDFAAGIVRLVEKLARESGAKSATDLITAVINWRNHEHSLAVAAEKDEKANQIFDKAEVLITIIEGLGASATPETVAAYLSSIFDESKIVPVTLSTIHKAKGLEWPSVYLLDFGLIFPRWADAQVSQNLAYVAVTRAQRTLTYISSARRAGAK